MAKVMLLCGELGVLLCGLGYSMVIAMGGNCTPSRDQQAQFNDAVQSTQDFLREQTRKRRLGPERKPIEQKEPGPPVEFAEEEERTWTSADGNFHVEATPTYYDPAKQEVSLRKANGETITIEVKKLSLEDRNYIRRLARE